MQKATVYDICLKTGLSTATVSRVLNQSGPVSQAARDKVLDAAQLLGYTPSFAARSLAKQRTNLIGAIFPRIAPGFFAEILGGIDDGVRDAGVHLLTSFSHGISDQKALAERFVSQGLVGVLILMNLHIEEEFIEYLLKQDVPVVTLDRKSSTTSSVSIDNVDGVKQALQHLADCGRQKLALLSGPLDAYDAQQRLQTSISFGPELGIEVPTDWILEGGFNEVGGYNAIKSLLAKGGEVPPAIFAFNDLMALGAIRALQEAGLRVPEDVSIVGFDNIDVAGLFNLTTVHVPMAEMGLAAAEIALAHLKGDTSHIERIVKPQLIVRGTTIVPGTTGK